MSDIPRNTQELAFDRTELAWGRSIMALERTLMAWIRTSLSLIGFGFAMFKFLQVMCTGGRILHHLRQNLPIPETAVLIVGFQSHGTLGRKLVDGAQKVRLLGEEVPVRASVHTMGGFSAHADQSNLLDWYSVLAPSKPRTIITHGEDSAREVFSNLIQSRFGMMSERPALDDVIEI